MHQLDQAAPLSEHTGVPFSIQAGSAAVAAAHFAAAPECLSACSDQINFFCAVVHDRTALKYLDSKQRHTMRFTALLGQEGPAQTS